MPELTDALPALIGLVAGLLIGSAGVGGAAFATPALVLALGVPAPVAIATDAVFCAVIKIFGLKAHRDAFRTSTGLLRTALLGSVPGAIAGAVVMNAIGHSEVGESFLRKALGVLLVLAAVLTVRRTFGTERSLVKEPMSKGFLLAGSVILGFLVGLTSIGAGCLFLPLLLACASVPFRTVVAIDIAQGLILALVLGATHFAVGQVDISLLFPLVLGGVPGVFMGAKLHHTLSSRALISTTASVIGVIGVRLML